MQDALQSAYQFYQEETGQEFRVGPFDATRLAAAVEEHTQDLSLNFIFSDVLFSAKNYSQA